MDAHPAEHQKKLRRILAVFVAGTLAVILLAVVALAVAMSRAIPVLTTQRFDEAKAQWDQIGPADYDITINVSGNQPAVYRVEVRQRQAISATHNGHPLTDNRTFSTWSVPGMFGTMGRDVETNRQAVAASTAVPLFLRAEFDPNFGFPQRYLRADERSELKLEQRQMSTTSWNVVEFEIVTDGESPE